MQQTLMVPPRGKRASPPPTALITVENITTGVIEWLEKDATAVENGEGLWILPRVIESLKTLQRLATLTGGKLFGSDAEAGPASRADTHGAPLSFLDPKNGRQVRSGRADVHTGLHPTLVGFKDPVWWRADDDDLRWVHASPIDQVEVASL
tara:strand:- start:1709 stop:2161 length:453 start_codon:yes stop_codon:yes gene_type:complete